ncbi:Protein ROOT PRIMORDIUM DEFECTIVE like [Actinidia chinensis var. chinensis]|uniref:Protein ROOT PRIMORDIUM DEFECTIVE like n=1 Tax=Actinidia chinensis var. chinensis TaxID=1590841 RepID=A0A2R6RP95_ACTCC|nr:Protein ROOT PRIMORDIUM DEFECTIVE like [Actinidia chinensis var. chinensis]
MQSLLRPLRLRRLRRHHYHHEIRRTLVDVASIKWVRDRGLDHAVERERNLRPLLNLKNLIKSEPSKSLPLSLIGQNREALGIATRPIDFVRRYPSVFEEFFPGGIGIHPHVKLTPEILDLDAEEELVYQSDSHRELGSDRLLKLLMLTRINKIPLHIIDRLKWDLGLPQDYVKTLVPEFPDYFRVTGGNGSDSLLELVCWNNELAVSVMEKKAMSGDAGGEKGMPIAFPLQYSRGFEADKEFKKWVEGWQKLPYISPYENALHLPPTSDEADRWAVAVLHELLHLLISKKTERENVLCIGEYLGLRSRFKRAWLHHPGIFYVSSKIWTHTVVLREGFKRNLLIENYPLMDMRSKYIHLMNKVKEDKKAKRLQSGSTEKQKSAHDSKGEGEEVQDDETENEQDEELYDSSDSEVEDNSDDDDEEGDEDRSRTVTHVNAGGDRTRTRRKPKYELKKPLRSANGLDRRYPNGTDDYEDELNEDRSRMVNDVNAGGDRVRTRWKPQYELKRPLRSANGLDRKYPSRNREPAEVSRGKVRHGRHDTRGMSPGRLEFSRDRGTQYSW